MTKSVRIENADMSNHKIVVEVWDEYTVDGEPKLRLVEAINLNNPTDMTTKTIWGSRHLVIREQKQT